MENLFSIVVLTYNQEHLIEECLNSILRQDYPRIELIVADDASTDSTVELVKKWIDQHQHKFDRVVFESHKYNRGIPKNHDFALRLAVGDYIKYIAGDDLLAPQALTKIADYFKNNSEVYWLNGLVLPFHCDEKRLMQESFNTDSLLPNQWDRPFFQYPAVLQERQIIRQNFICSAGVAFRKGTLDGIGFFDTSFSVFEDHPTWIRLIRNHMPIRLLPEVVAYWRRHPASVTQSSLSKLNHKVFEDQRMNLEKNIIHYIKPHDFYTRIHVWALRTYLNYIIRHGCSLPAHKKGRWIRLLDPVWWRSKIYSAIFNHGE